MRNLPQVRVSVDTVALAGGLDVVSGPYSVRPGALRYANNYETIFSGGYERVRGYELFDGHPSPAEAEYVVSVPEVAYTDVLVGQTVTGLTSGNTGVCIAVEPTYIVMTKATGPFTVGESMQTLGVTRGIHSSVEPAIDGFTDNNLNKLAADEYRPAIAKPPGEGEIRGVATLGSTTYVWRNAVGGATKAIYKSTAAGWVLVALNYEISFTLGTTVYAEGSTITQGANSATVKRVVLETGEWSLGTSAGRLIITVPAPGAFIAGAAAGGGACTLSGAATAITLMPGGRVEVDAYNFAGFTNTRRLYGCDGVGPEFEFDGEVYVPLNTGMTSVRASFVKCHKNYLWFAYLGSLQKSVVGSPYAWSGVLGAADFPMGDTISGLVSIGGSEANAALMALSLNSIHTVYGPDSAGGFNVVPLSFEAGANPYSVQDVGTPLAHDVNGFAAYAPAQSFGNFVWESASSLIYPLVRNQIPQASVFVKDLGRYRCFFQDGSIISGTPVGKGKFSWLPLAFPHRIMVAYSAEVGSATRTFYGTDEGWVIEADVGRSFAGEAIDYSLKTAALFQKGPVTIKQYRGVEYESSGRSAFTLSVSAEYTSADADSDQPATVDFQQLSDFGSGLVWGGSAWGEARWGAGEATRKRIREPGQGVAVALLMGGSSDSELSHDLKSVFIPYTPRRLAR